VAGAGPRFRFCLLRLLNFAVSIRLVQAADNAAQLTGGTGDVPGEQKLLLRRGRGIFRLAKGKALFL